ncbi:hypothetical protein JMG10_02660 [Nostoc ellipsosporum NOK]|nr:hypothetical protein [Nostoc ellipsosporum NOK]
MRNGTEPNSVSTKMILLSLQSMIAFSLLCGCGTTDSVENVKLKFKKNETEFLGLVTFFRSVIPKGNDKIIEFSLAKNGNINMWIYPSVINSNGKPVGGKDMDKASIDSVHEFGKIGFSADVLRQLRIKLEKTGYTKIRTTDVFKNPIEVYNEPKGWTNYSLYFFEDPVDEILIQRYGRPITDTGFGSCVVITN